MAKNDYQKCKSTIAIAYSQGVKAIQVYYDGSFERMGNKLLKHYGAWQNTMKMMSKGDIVVLGENLKPFDAKKNTVGTVDLTMKGKDKVDNKVFDSIADLIQTETDSEYMYLWIKDTWYGMKIDKGLPYMSNGFYSLTTLV